MGGRGISHSHTRKSMNQTATFGLIGSMQAARGKRDELIEILLRATENMPGCLSYVVAKDRGDDDTIWITELWESKESHEASLRLPTVRQAIAEGRTLIAEFGERIETAPVTP